MPPGDFARDFFERLERRGGEHEWNAGIACRAGKRDVGGESIQSGGAGGRDAERRVEGLAEHAHLLRAAGNIDQRVRPQANALERRAVIGERHVVFDAAGKKVVGNPRQALFRHAAQIFDVQCVSIAH